MESRKKTLAIVALLCLLVIGVLIALIVRHSNNTDWIYFESERNMDSIVHVEVSLLDENDIVFIVDKDHPRPTTSRSYIPSHYILGTRIKGQESEDIIQEFLHIENIIYDLLSGEEVKVIDLFEIMEEFEEQLYGYELIGASPLVEMLDSGDIYLIWRFSNREMSNFNIQNIIMNYETGEISFYDSEARRTSFTESERELRLQRSFFRQYWVESDLDSFYNDNGFINNEFEDFSVLRAFPETTTILLIPENLPLESESLYSRFPELRDFQGQDGLEINVLLTGNLTAEEIFEMFMEDGHEIVFDGLIMSGYYSIDGEEHEINSFEDYFRLRDFSDWDDEQQYDNDEID